MKPIIIFSLILLLHTAIGCYSDSPVLNINGADGNIEKLIKYEAVFNIDKLYSLELTIRENEEAELMALCLSGEIIAPEGLYNRVLSDMTFIRSEYADLFDGKSAGTFLPSWLPGCVMIRFTPEAALRVKNGEYTSWDRLNNAFGISRVDLDLIEMDIAVVFTDYRLNFNTPVQNFLLARALLMC